MLNFIIFNSDGCEIRFMIDYEDFESLTNTSFKTQLKSTLTFM